MSCLFCRVLATERHLEPASSVRYYTNTSISTTVTKSTKNHAALSSIASIIAKPRGVDGGAGGFGACERTEQPCTA